MQIFPSNSDFTYKDFQPAPYSTYHADVVAVLDSVKLLFSKYFACVDALPLSVINNSPDRVSPETIRELHTIYLVVDATDKNGNPGCYWCQFINQFSHEFCHYMITKHVVQPMRWFEETLCELASQFFLIKSVERWMVQPPYAAWRKYSTNILDYELKKQIIDCPFCVSDLFNPASSLTQSLEKDEYMRKYNCAIATKLLPYFIDSPSLWNIIYYLPKLSEDKTFGQNLHLLQKISGQPIEKVILSFI